MNLWLRSLRISPDDLETYSGERWRTMSLEIRARDKFKCRKCGVSRNLHVHHRWPWARARKRGWWAFRISNLPFMLVTLCNDCHEEVHDRDLNHDGRIGHPKKGWMNWITQR